LTKKGIGRVDQEDYRARGLLHDLVDQGEGMLRALSETDQRDFGSRPGGYGSDVLDVGLVGDHLVSEVRDYRRGERQPIHALVGDRHSEMLSTRYLRLREMLNARYLRLLQEAADGPLASLGVRWAFALPLPSAGRFFPAPTLGRCMGVSTSHGLRHDHQR
jgi:hypothetical protein